MEQEFRRIKVELIDPPHNPVRLSANDTNVDELAESIKQHGLLQPITVFPVNGRFETLVGDRRQRACKAAGLEEIPCIIVDDPDKLTQVVRLTENIQREDMSPIEEGAILKDLQDLNNWGYKTLAAHLGKGVQWIRDRLSLIELPPDVTILVHNKQINIQHAKLLGRITDESTRKEYAQEVMKQGTSARTLELWVELWEHAQDSPDLSGDHPPEPSTLPQVKPHEMRCQLCEGFYPVKHLISIITCRGCLRIIQEVKRADISVASDTHPGDRDRDPGVGDTDGAPTIPA